VYFFRAGYSLYPFRARHIEHPRKAIAIERMWPWRETRQRTAFQKQEWIEMAGRKPGGPKTGGRKPGTQNKATIEVKQAAQVFTAEAIETLAEIMRGQEQPAAARVAAASAILDRGHGKPKQAVENSGPDGGPQVFTWQPS
jgi:hypothetical protein